MTSGGEQIKLVGVSGSYRGNEFYIDKDEYIIGRASDCDLVITEKTVSGHHAKLVRTGDQYELLDLNSTNGTFVNGARVQRKVVRTDDVIKFDVFEFRYLNPGEVARTMISQAPDFSREAEARPPAAAAAPESGQSFRPDQRYQSPRPASSEPPKAERPSLERRRSGHLVAGLIIGLLFGLLVLYGGIIGANLMSSPYGFDFMAMMQSAISGGPTMYTHFVWVNPNMSWNAGMVLVLVAVILAPMIGGLLTRVVGGKGAFITALVFSLLFTAIVFVLQLVGLGFNFAGIEFAYMTLTGIYTSAAAIAAVLGYCFGVSFVLSLLMASLIRK